MRCSLSDMAADDTRGLTRSTPTHSLSKRADADYRLVVVSDCCADPDPEVHRVLTEKVFARPATVTTAAAVIAALN